MDAQYSRAKFEWVKPLIGENFLIDHISAKKEDMES